MAFVHRRRGGSGDESSTSGKENDSSESGIYSNNGCSSSHEAVGSASTAAAAAAADRRIFQRQYQQQQQHNYWWYHYCFQSWSPFPFRGKLLDRIFGGRKRNRSPLQQRQGDINNVGCSSSRRSSMCVLISFLVWLSAIVLTQERPSLNRPSPSGSGSVSSNNNNPSKMARQERVKRRNEMRRSNNSTTTAAAPSGGGGVSKFLKDAAFGLYNVVDTATGKTSIVKKQRSRRGGGKKDKESDLPGCTRPKWQHYNLVNCNDIHEVDLGTIHKRQLGLEGPAPTSFVGYIGSGLWRSVYAVDPRQSVMPNQSVVIKIMKDEHDVNTRNFERHRRDALTMERLTSSPHIVDIYGFCGNTVLTEFTANSLDRIIYRDNGDDENNTHGGDETISAQTTAAALHLPTRRTAQGRLQLFLDVARGLQAIHNIKGGPIVHADLQAKQFLIDVNGVVKINDFNRCRFMASKNGAPCKFRIPSAPGKYRSPEEYNDDELDEKLDIYSSASVFYSIITGERAFDDLSTGDTRKYVKKGVKPKIGDEYRIPGTIDAALTNLTELAYTKNPEERISASQLVAALEEIQAKHPLEDQNTMKD